MLITKSFVPTPSLFESAKPVTVVIEIPVVNVIPSGSETLAADNGGITKDITTPEPAVGVVAILWNATFLAEPFELYMYQPLTVPALALITVGLVPLADTKSK